LSKEAALAKPRVDLTFTVCLEDAGEFDVQHVHILGLVYAESRHVLAVTEPQKTAWPLGVPTLERPAAIRLFFRLWARAGPPSGKDCRLRRRPASRRRIDAPPVDGLDVRRSVRA